MATKTILLEIDVEEGDEAVVKELLGYLSHTKRIKKYLWREKNSALPKVAPIPPTGQPAEIPFRTASTKPEAAPAAKPAAANSKPSSPQIMALLDLLAVWKKDNKLIRLKALKGKGKVLDIACKIVSYDADTGTVTVYDVDQKVVETVRLMEIEDIDLALV